MHVIVSHEDPALQEAATFVRLDLVGNGFETSVVAGEVQGCSEVRAGESTGVGALVLLTLADGDGIEARVCTPQTKPPRVGRVFGRLTDPQSLSILVTEAVNGLLAEPMPAGAETASVDDAASGEQVTVSERDEAEPAWIEVQARMLQDASSQAVWGALASRLGVPLAAEWSLDVELVASFLPVRYAEPEMRLSGSLAWAQAGLSETLRVGAFHVRCGVAAGAYSTRVVAEAQPPWTDGTDGAFGAVFSARGSVRFPASELWFVSGSLGASTLVPQFRYRMASSATPYMGALLLEGSLGVGLRLGSWTTPDAAARSR